MKHNVVRFFSMALIMCTVVMFSTVSLTVTASSGTVYESESNNTVSTADMTYDDYDSYGYISSTSDVDWWKVTFSSEGIANFYLGSIPSGCNYQLRVYNYTGNKLLVESLKTSNSSELCKVHVRAGEAYYIKIYSASGYSATDTYKFRFKRYDLNEVGIFTSTHINNSQNYNGSTFWNQKINGMGYTSHIYSNYYPSYMFDEMPGYSLVFANTHGEAGGINLYVTENIYRTLHGTDYIYMPTGDRAVANYPSSSSLSNNVLVLYDACEAGSTSNKYGNLVDETLNKGAFACLGWTVIIHTVDANLWGMHFLDYCQQGQNIGNAVVLANNWADECDYLTNSDSLILHQYRGNSHFFAALLG